MWMAPNGSPQQIPFQFVNEKLPHSCCAAFWAWTERNTYFKSPDVRLFRLGILS